MLACCVLSRLRRVVAPCSTFGGLFRKAADATAAQVKHDGFDLSVIEIKKEDLRKVYGTSALPP